MKVTRGSDNPSCKDSEAKDPQTAVLIHNNRVFSILTLSLPSVLSIYHAIEKRLKVCSYHYLNCAFHIINDIRVRVRVRIWSV